MADASRRPRLAVTLGDPNGIGPEVVLKALADPAICARVEVTVVGARATVIEWADRLGVELDPAQVLSTRAAPGPLVIGQVTAEGGEAAMAAVRSGCDACLAGAADALVTAPLSKEAIALAGYDFPGHTEFLATQTGADRYAMMLVSGPLRVALVTIHVPLRAVADLITEDRIVETLHTVDGALRQDFGIEAPRLAVLGLNPHAGDGGVIGREEIETIMPALEKATAEGLSVAGPFAADGFFGRRADLDFDAVIAMYHDQGLAPFKALAMGAGVNVTAGLPIVRTSPDHGTAFAIAGQNVASPDSMKTALLLAADLAESRARYAAR